VEDAFKKLVEGGEAELTWMILNREEETLHLQFKTASGDVGTKLSKDDRKNISKGHFWIFEC
jgi:hypothetical protein